MEQNQNNESNEIKREDKFDVTVTVSSDYYEAFLNVIIQDDTFNLTKDDIMKALDEKHISFGINYHLIDKIVSDNETVYDVLIASGRRHENGEDGKISYKINLDSEAKPTILADGSVDFKHMNYLKTVEKGQVLATRTSPTNGTSGTTVTNKKIKGRDGKIANFKIGKNVELSKDETQIISTVDGSVKVKNDKIEVVEILTINGNVGVETGSIEFHGDIIVNGNVLSGYNIVGSKDVTINGVVEGSDIKASGNIIITGGVQGNDQANLFAGGFIKSKFFNNCFVSAQGEIETESILHSDINTNKSVFVMGKKGQIVGGVLNVRDEIKAKKIGSEIGTITVLNLGLTNELTREFNDVKKKIKSHTKNIDKLSKIVAILNKKIQVAKIKQNIQKQLDETEPTLNQMKKELPQLKKRYKELIEIIKDTQHSRVSANEINVGVKIKIGASHYNVKESLAMVEVKKVHGEIKLFALK